MALVVVSTLPVVRGGTKSRSSLLGFGGGVHAGTHGFDVFRWTMILASFQRHVMRPSGSEAGTDPNGFALGPYAGALGRTDVREPPCAPSSSEVFQDMLKHVSTTATWQPGADSCPLSCVVMSAQL
jgi:hypothetical protein